MPTDAEGLPDSFYAGRANRGRRAVTQEDRKDEAITYALAFLQQMRNSALRDSDGLVRVSENALRYQIRRIEEIRDGR